MAIHAITGAPGSGKSFELVREHVLPTLRDQPGRRFITNVSGLNYQAIADHLGMSLTDVQTRLISVPYERVSQPNFWYDPENGTTDTVVQPGDKIGLDEVWRYYNRGEKIPPDAMRFFRMHRHYTHPVHGYACDVVLLNQSFRGIHSDISDVVEVQFKCRKLKALGRPQNYQVHVIENGERTPSHSLLRAYDPAIFPLYQSYDGANATEVLDPRQSIFSAKFFKIVLPVFAVLSVVSAYHVYQFFQKPAAFMPGASPATSASLAPSVSAAPKPAAAASLDWRVVATYRVGGTPVHVLYRDGAYRTVAGVPTTSLLNDVYAVPPPDVPGVVSTTTGTPPRLLGAK